ncbi:UTP--glucose-1-phosphate uridylyltransferase [Yoonia sp.]|uniref:UTP--glucose-1-phosphate uridylyltransferase n=1 Tax=Yoonia sp. TaxID=2212373 RepID=UPI001A015952|nr:UTP--glucose-1-phosphate uridylyltransferase [Yoonia sp.]MBE0414282.1 UTP--glucose-1-phosphate uridylyltransferase [Yoonia sp.]
MPEDSEAIVKTAIFPVAGLGTRFLPATKATPKELLPVIDTPLIQYAIDEARDAGVERIVFVSHPSKSAIERHVQDDADLRERGKARLARELKQAAIDEDLHDVVFVMQDEPLGLGHAVLCARDNVLPGPVAVILPDDLIVGSKECLSEMIAAYPNCDSGHMVATIDVARDDVASYGILSVLARNGRVIKANGMVEKPDPAAAPSKSAVVGRYVLDAAIFDALARQTPGVGGEIQQTDAIATQICTTGLSGFAFSGQRFDCGSKQGMLAAGLHLARQDPAFDAVLDEFVAGQSSSTAA